MSQLSIAERLVRDRKIVFLSEIADRSEWDRYLVEQAVFIIGAARTVWTCNDVRELLPEQGHGYLGAAISALRSAGIIAHTGRMVPSTSTATKGHRIHEWLLTEKGRQLAAQRSAPAEAAA